MQERWPCATNSPVMAVVTAAEPNVPQRSPVVSTTTLRIALILALLTVVPLLPTAAGASASEITTVSNRADLVSGGDALVEISPAPTPGSVVDLDGTDVTDAFATGLDGRHLGLVSGLSIGDNTLTVTQPDGSGATLTIRNHPTEGPVFSGPHIMPWDCTTDAALGEPDANCNVDAVVDYQYVAEGGSGYQAYDPDNPPGDVAMVTTDAGATVPHIVRRERGSMNRGLYAFAFLHDPADGEPDPRDPGPGWNRKLHYTFGASCNTNNTQGSMPSVLNATRLAEGFAIATSSLNVLGHHCNPVLSAETAMMLKERVIETAGPIRYTMSTGGSGGAIGQLQVSNAYPGITNGLMPSSMFPDVWSTAMEVHDCVISTVYFAAAPFTPLQKAAVDGHGAPQSSCAAWLGTFAPGGIAMNGCYSNSGVPTTNTPDPQRDYNPVTNPDGCRATIQDIQRNVWGLRESDGFAHPAHDNTGVQYGLKALNLPATDPGKITMAQFLDLNARIGGVTVDGLPTPERTRMPDEVSEILYRSSMINDGRGLAQAAIINFAAGLNVEIHTPYHAYVLEARMAEIGHADNHVIWHNGPSGTAWDTMDDWLARVEAMGGIDPLFGMDPGAVKAARDGDVAFDSCWSGSTQQALAACESEVFADHRIQAGMDITHDATRCTKKPIDPADYAGAGVPLTPADLAALDLIFPDGVCDYTQPAVNQVESVQWLTYANGPGGEPLGPPPVSTAF